MAALRVLVVAGFDSFLRAGAACARQLEKAVGAQVEYALLFTRLGQISPQQQRSLGFESLLTPQSMERIATKANLQRFDLVIVALNGMRTRRFMSRFAKMWTAQDVVRPLTLSLYPGVLLRFQLEGMMSRSSCDILLVNSPDDYRVYTAAREQLGLEDNNALCAGLRFLADERLLSPPGPRGDVVFVGQPTMPAGRAERMYVVDQLVELAHRFPDRSFVVKPRHRRTETTLHKVKYHYEDLLDEHLAGAPRPPNLLVSYEAMSLVLDRTGLCLTFSSTAALEALARSIPTRVLTDLGVHEHLGNHYFLGSGLLCDLADVVPDMPFVVNEQWFVKCGGQSSVSIDEVVDRVEWLRAKQRAAKRVLPPPGKRLFGRSPAYNRFVERAEGWLSLEQFGDSGSVAGSAGPHSTAANPGAAGHPQSGAALAGCCRTREFGTRTTVSGVAKRSARTPPGLQHPAFGPASRAEGLIRVDWRQPS